EHLLEPLAAAPATDNSGDLTTHLLRRRADGTLDDDDVRPRRWLPWAVAVAAVLALGAEVVALRRGGPIPATAARRVPSLPEGLRIETRPPGASVWMDGRPAGPSARHRWTRSRSARDRTRYAWNGRVSSPR